MNKNNSNLISEIKSDIISYFDANKFEIDIKAQELLRDSIINNGSDKQKNKIMEYNKKLIKIVEDIFEENMKKMNEESTKDLIESFNSGNDKNMIKSMILNKCCYFIRSDYLMDKIIPDNIIGLIIITDWFLDENQINFLKVRFYKESMSKGITFVFDENVVNLSFGLKELEFKYFKNKIRYRIELEKTEIIRKLTKLESFKFFNKYIENESCISIKASTFKNMKRIKEIELLDNLVEIDTFYYLHHLKILFLTGKPIQLNQENFVMNDEYNVIAPQVNLLDSIKNLTNLEMLRLVKSTIQIDDQNSFGSFPKLKHLDLTYSLSNHIPIGTFTDKFNNLESLCLNKCYLNQIQDNLFISLKKLHSLNLSFNNINVLNENTFNGLENLQDLYLANSGINEIKLNTFSKLINLTYLDIYGSSLEVLYENEFFGLINLINLNLINNNIKQIKRGAFKSLNKLKTLNLRANQIEELHDNVMEELNSLLYLNFADNKIMTINLNAFYGLCKIRKIDLSENHIRSFDYYEFKSKYGLETLSEFIIDGSEESQGESEDEFEILDFDSDSSEEDNHLFYRITFG